MIFVKHSYRSGKKQLITNGKIKRQRRRFLTISEIYDHSDRLSSIPLSNLQSLLQWKSPATFGVQSFQGWVSYTRFVEYIPSVLVPFDGLSAHFAAWAIVQGSLLLTQPRWMFVWISASIPIKYLQELAERGKTSTGWFFGFKLHLLVNDRGELLQFCLSPGNVDDRKPVPRLGEKVVWQAFWRQGDISHNLWHRNYMRCLMSNSSPSYARIWKVDWCFYLIEFCCVEGLLLKPLLINSRTFSQIEHSRHRSCVCNFFVNVMYYVVWSLTAIKPAKPSLGLDAAYGLASLTRIHVK